MNHLEPYIQLGSQKQGVRPDSVYLIAETAFNHEGDLNYLLKMIRMLKDSGADAVKFHVLIDLDAYMNPDHSLFTELKEWLLSSNDWKKVFAECRKNGLSIVGLADDTTSLQFMIDESVDILAIHASSLHDLFMLRMLAQTKTPLLIGVGGATSAEIKFTVQKLSPKKNLIFMYGLQQYPTPLSSLHLTKIPRFEEEFGVPVGYADHATSQQEIERTMAYTAAYALGARIFEQHVTLDLDTKRLDNESAILASSYHDFSKFTQQLKLMTGFSYRGNLKAGEKQYTHSRKQLVAKRDLPKGTVLTEEDISFKRNEQKSDLVASDFENIIGQTIRQNTFKGQIITSSQITGRRCSS